MVPEGTSAGGPLALSGVRVGIGWDLHRLVTGRSLFLGGVCVPYSHGLAGHSDADVVLHALCDALLGAAALGDIGELFPDSDPAWKGAASRRLVATVVERLRAAGYRPINVDLIVQAEQPRLGRFKAEIAQSVAGMLGLDPSAVGVKAKTGEGLDAVGRGEAIACWAVALVARDAGQPTHTRAGGPM